MIFKCTQCGDCCKNLRNIDIELNIGKDKKSIIIPLTEEDNITLPLWDWEAEDIDDASIKPLAAIYDSKSNTTIILQYFIDSNDCIFLKDNKCSIYEKRPLICRTYPLQTKMERTELKVDFLKCKSLDKQKINEMDITQIHEAFGNILLGAVQYDYINYWQKKLIDAMIKENLIKTEDYNKNTIKNMMGSKKIPFTKFLIENNIINEKELKETIKKFNSYFEAKTALGLL